MTKTTTKAKAATKESTPAAPLIVLGYDENYKPRAARFPATDVDAGHQGRPPDGPQGL